ncbi:hypothetical protein B7P43_G02524, partial [Cryptotermes secundus]
QKVIESDVVLLDLDNVANSLQQWTPQFAQPSGRLERKHWWENETMKMMMMIFMATFVLLFVIAVVWTTSSASSNEPTTPVSPAPP